jgi:cation diffusion facilitator CzcD-associated flavoprotein CzcO
MMTEKTESFDAVIVGAGFAGLYMLYKCREIGLRAHVFEAGGGLGGTWYWNRYPGARCDTESIMYSYSFDPELEQEWSWSERYAAQPEIRAYLDHVADRYDLRRDIDLETRVVAAHFNDVQRRWRVTTADGRSAECRYFITAVGCLSIATAPQWPGQAEFRGQVIHTSSWPEEEPDLTGKRVGVVGTGSSAIQAIPLIAERADELIVFQRTASFSLPARNAPTDPEEERRIKASYEELRERARTSPIGNFWDMPTKSALEVSAEEREETFEKFWQAGSARFVMAFTDLTRNLDANGLAADFVRRKIAATVQDPETARKLTPHGYPIATKRLCLDTGYYETYDRPNVELVDVSADPIVSLTPTGLRTEHAAYDLDVLVFATGFDAVTGAFSAIDIRGKGGVELRDRWADGPRTYLGLASAGFPNMFMITGPLSPSALSIVTISIEQHVDWIGDAIVYLSDHGLSVIETDETFEAEWDREVDAAVARTLHPFAQFTYYWGGNIPGKPRKFLQYTGGVGPYRAICDAVVKDGYRGFMLS